MPHDANGKLIQVGDEVVLRCKVAWVGEGEGYCNVTIDTVYFMPPYTEPTRFSMVNAKQVEVVSVAEEGRAA